MQAQRAVDYDDIYTYLSEKFRAEWSRDPCSDEVDKLLSLLEIISDAMRE